jgi:hypothetical protein
VFVRLDSVLDDGLSENVGLFHLIGDSLEYEKDDDDCAQKVCPDVDRLVVDHKQ